MPSQLNMYPISRNGWGATAVDAFSTALVMGKWDVVKEILEFVPTINFSNTTDEVSLFETTIRYLGGLISGKPKPSSPCCHPDRNSYPGQQTLTVLARSL
jgi:mannosyl-oligosaccharide alpha-1,2-mannosidase